MESFVYSTINRENKNWKNHQTQTELLSIDTTQNARLRDQQTVGRTDIAHLKR